MRSRRDGKERPRPYSLRVVDAGEDAGDEEGTLARRALFSFLEILALTGFAITQPLLEVFGRAPDRFLLRDANPADIVVFALVVALAPAAALWVVEWLVWAAGERARRITHALILGLLTAILVLQVVRRSDTVSGVALVLLAIAIGAAFVAACQRWRPMRTWLALASGATVLYLGVFFFTSPTAALLSDEQVAIADVGTIRDPRPVVILQFDEWPLASIMNDAGELDADLYPNLAALAADGTWYRNATTVATFTSHAVPAILTGRYPREEAVPTVSAYPENLFTAFGGQYDVEAQEMVTRLCPGATCTRTNNGGDTGLTSLLSDARQAFGVMVSPDTTRVFNPATTSSDDVNLGLDGTAELRLESVDRMLSSITSGEGPTVHYLHLLLPHMSYRFLPSGQAYEGQAVVLGGGDPLGSEITRSSDPVAAKIAEQRLILQAQFADRVVGQVVARLEETGLYDDAVIAVLADHGVGFVPGQYTRAIPEGPAGESLYPDLLYVPMVLKGPGLTAGEVSDTNAETIDVFPTIAEMVGLDLPWDVDGIALTSQSRPTNDKQFHIVTVEAAVGEANSLGPRLSFDGDVFGPRVSEHGLDTVLYGDNPEFRSYNVSEAGELVGRPVQELITGAPSPWQATRDAPERLDDYRPTNGIVPARLTGRVTGPGPAERPTIAIALNGRVAAVVETHTMGDIPHRIEAMLVPELIVPGANDVAFYVVEGPDGARTLHPLTIG